MSPRFRRRQKGGERGGVCKESGYYPGVIGSAKVPGVSLVVHTWPGRGDVS